MGTYNMKWNADDSVVRHLIVGLLADLNNKVYFHRQLSETERAVIDVPFYYAISGDDQFLRDNFLFSTPSGPDCVPDVGFADGNYDVVPRGVAQLTSLSIDSSKLVNKGVRGEYTKIDKEGAMQGYSAEFQMIPVVLSFDLEILVSSTLDSLKISEMLIKRLYKSNYYNIEVGHLEDGTFRLAAYYALPDDFEMTQPIDYTFDGKDEYKLSIPIEVHSFIPSFEDSTEMHVGNRIFEITSTVSDNTGIAPQVSKKTIK